MTSWTEILKANKGLHARDSFSELWGMKLKAARAEFPDYTITGYLPMIFKSRAAVALKNYRIHGTSAGAGVETESGEPAGYKIPILNTSGVTENLVGFSDGSISFTGGPSNLSVLMENGILTFNGYATGEIYSNNPKWKSLNFYLDAGTYYITSPSPLGTGFGRIIRTMSDESVLCGTTEFVFTLQEKTEIFIAFYIYNKTFDNDEIKIMIVQGSTPPNHYIPHRYESNYDLFIGSTKLMADEFVDYGEQKVYKRTENLFDKSTAIFGKEIQGNRIVDNAYWAITPLIPVEPQNYYSTLSFGVARLEYISENDNNPTRTVASSQNPTLSTTHFIRLNLEISNLTTATLVSGSTPPETYIPYLQPTDPPAPFPPIPTYKGENTLSITEMVGEVSITGKITEMA